MLELFINNQRVDVAEEQLEAKVTYQFLDTYQPEALIGAHSKTVTLPDTATNNTIFANFQERYSALILQDGGRVVMSGYATLDNMTSNGLSDKYELTLYDNLGEFFHNLKFKDSTETAEKSLADMYFNLYGFNPTTETPDVKVLTIDEFYPHNSWLITGSATEATTQESTFTIVPGNFEMKNFDKEKMIFDETNTGSYIGAWTDTHFFKSGSDDGSGSLIQQGGRQYVLVSDMEENTPYAMMNIPVTHMPLGIRYRKVIEACCRAVNNGGYTVNLDPDWFNTDNPYWTEMFILNKQPASEVEYSTNTSTIDLTYPATETTGSQTVYLLPVSGSTTTPWTVGSNYLYTNNIVNSVELTTKFKPVVQVTGSVTLPWTYTVRSVGNGTVLGQVTGSVVWNINSDLSVSCPSPGYALPSHSFNNIVQAHPPMRLIGHIQCIATIRDLNTNQILDSEGMSFNQVDMTYNSSSGYYEMDGEGYEMVLGAMGNTLATATTEQIRLELNISQASTTVLKYIYNLNRTAYEGLHGAYLVQLTFPGDAYSANSTNYGFSVKCGWPAGQFTPTLTTKYNSATTVVGAFPQYSKKEIMGNLGTPLDWFIKYLRMFNLRVYCHRSTKEVDIMTLDNYINKFGPEDITGKIDFSRDYKKTRNIIDEAAIKWNVDPQKNESVERLEDFNVHDPFDRIIRIKQYGTEEYDYLNTEIKIGLEARKQTPFLVREKAWSGVVPIGQTPPYFVRYLFGINQTSPVVANYVDTDGNLVESEYNIQYVDQRTKYTTLEVDGDVTGTLVLRNGWKTIYKDECGFGTCAHTPLPILTYQPSVQMIALAEKPCYLGGVVETAIRSETWFTYYTRFNCPVVQEYRFPVFGNTAEGGWGLTYRPEAFESINSPQDIYTRCFKDFIERTYIKPEVVECYVFLDEPELRKLYWFDNRYWILSKIEDYDPSNPGPTKCTFIKYKMTGLHISGD